MLRASGAVREEQGRPLNVKIRKHSRLTLLVVGTIFPRVVSGVVFLRLLSSIDEAMSTGNVRPQGGEHG